MDRQIERFRREVESHFGGRPGRGARYPEALRVEAVAMVIEALSEGGSLGSVAKRLGVGAGTLQRWLEAPPRQEVRELRPVEVVEVEAGHLEPVGSEGHLVLVTATGHRVEGLGLEEVAVLLEALG